MNPFLSNEFEAHYQASPLITLIDVGARGGVHERWQRCKKYFRAIGFAPDEEAFKQLEDTNPELDLYRYVNAALGGKPEELDLNIARNRGGSSLLTPNRTFWEEFPVPLATR